MYLLFLYACEAPSKASDSASGEVDSPAESQPTDSPTDSPADSPTDSPTDSPRDTGRDSDPVAPAVCGDGVVSIGEYCWTAVVLSGVDPSGLSVGYCNLPAVNAGDLDGDGLDELGWLTADGEAFTLSLAHNEGGGVFRPLLQSTIGAFPDNLERVDIVDTDADGDNDVVVTVGVDGGMGAVLTLNNDGLGGVVEGARLDLPTSVCHLSPGDFNGDGVADLLAGAGAYSTDPLRLLAGDGSGGYQSSTTHDLDDCALRGIATADLDGDGALDVAAACGFESAVTKAVQPRQGLGNGGFTAWEALSLDVNPTSIAVDDLDGDGALDVVVADEGGETFAAMGDGDGSFAALSSVGVTAPSARGTGAWDLDQDGAADLLDRSSGGWWRSNFDGSFADVAPLVDGLSGVVLAEGHFDPDQVPDLLLVTSDGTFYLVLSGG